MSYNVPATIQKKLDQFTELVFSKAEIDRDLGEITTELLFVASQLNPDKKLNAAKVLSAWSTSYAESIKKEKDKFQALSRAIAAIFHHNEVIKDGQYENWADVPEVAYINRQDTGVLISRKEAAEEANWKQQNFYYHEQRGNLIPYNWRGEQVQISFKGDKYYNKEVFMKLINNTLKTTKNGAKKRRPGRPRKTHRFKNRTSA